MDRWICYLFSNYDSIHFMYTSEPLENGDEYQTYECSCPDEFFTKEDIDWAINEPNGILYIVKSKHPEKYETIYQSIQRQIH